MCHFTTIYPNHIKPARHILHPVLCQILHSTTENDPAQPEQGFGAGWLIICLRWKKPTIGVAFCRTMIYFSEMLAFCRHKPKSGNRLLKNCYLICAVWIKKPTSTIFDSQNPAILKKMLAFSWITKEKANRCRHLAQ